jgi:hypothetical protein
LSWIVFTYSLPSKSSSSPRVALWRRLRRIGSISISGVQILPDRDICLESFQWLAKEVQQANGEYLLMRVEYLEGISDRSIIDKFRETRQEDYASLEAKIEKLENIVITANTTAEIDRTSIRETLEKLYKHHNEIQQVDFFGCPEREKIATRLNQLTQALLPQDRKTTVTPQNIEDYRRVTWVTRPRPHVDRLACIWLIRRFINPQAIVRYSKTIDTGETPFDTNEDIFQHQGNLCTFEVMAKSFGLEDLGLQTIGEIVHEIDLRDGLYLHPQIAGVDTLLQGWLLAGFDDVTLETHGIALFEGLYTAFLRDVSPESDLDP